MGTTADKLSAILSSKEAIRQAVNNKGGNLTTESPLRDYPSAISDLPQSSGGWQPEPDWWDIKAILNNYKLTDNTARYIMLICDAGDSTMIDSAYYPATKYIFSDGTEYILQSGDRYITHVWDPAYDKPCSKGYSTRYFIGCRDSSDSYTIAPTFIGPLYLYIIDSVLRGIGSNTYQIVTIQAVECADTVTMPAAISNVSSWRSLRKMDIPAGVTSINTNTFSGDTALAEISIPSSVSVINTSAFTGCSALYEVVIPEGVTTINGSAFSSCYGMAYLHLPSTLTSILNSAFTGCYGLVSVTVAEGTILPALNLSWANYLSNSSLRNMAQMLGTAETSRTITLNADVKARLTDDDIALFNSKNYTIA